MSVKSWNTVTKKQPTRNQ